MHVFSEGRKITERKGTGMEDRTDSIPSEELQSAVSAGWNETADIFASIPSAQLEAELQWTPVAPNPYAVGSIWHTSWGYDQTNVEFLQVVRESKASVWLVPMGSTIRDGRQWPTTTTGIAKPSMHRKGKHGAYVRLDYVRSAWPYNGGGCYDTYAAGDAGH